MKSFKSHLEEARVTPGDLKAQAEGKKAARQGVKYDENPYEKGSSRHLQWSKGHNAARAAGMREDVELDEAKGDMSVALKVDKATKKRTFVVMKDGKAVKEFSNWNDASKFAGYKDARNEEVELDEGFKKGDSVTYINNKGKKVTGIVAKRSTNSPKGYFLDTGEFVSQQLVIESVEQIDEISQATKASYLKKADKDSYDMFTGKKPGSKEKMDKRRAAIQKVSKELEGKKKLADYDPKTKQYTREEVELDEGAGDNEMYSVKAATDAVGRVESSRMSTKFLHALAPRGDKEVSWSRINGALKEMGVSTQKIAKVLQTLKGQIREEVELEEAKLVPAKPDAKAAARRKAIEKAQARKNKDDWFADEDKPKSRKMGGRYGYGEYDEAVETDGPRRAKLNFKLSTTDTGQKYLTKKARERADMNQKNDPGSVKKGMALSVLDKTKAAQKAIKKGIKFSPYDMAVGKKPNKMQLIQKGLDPKMARESVELDETTVSATKKPVNVTGPDGKTRTVMRSTKTKQYDDHGQDKIRTEEEYTNLVLDYMMQEGIDAESLTEEELQDIISSLINK